MGELWLNDGKANHYFPDGMLKALCGALRAGTKNPAIKEYRNNGKNCGLSGPKGGKCAECDRQHVERWLCEAVPVK